MHEKPAPELATADNSRRFIICDGPGHPTQPATTWANLEFRFGPKNGLTDSQLQTIQWLRRLGGRTVMKKSMVHLALIGVSEEKCGRIVEILAKESIPFTVAP
jgi:hypothetical protein